MRLEELELGAFRIEGVVAAAPAEGRERSTGYGAHRIIEKFGGDGILGHEGMRNFLVTIALGTDNVHFYAEQDVQAAKRCRTHHACFSNS